MEASEIRVINGPPPKAELLTGPQFDQFCKYMLGLYLQDQEKKKEDNNGGLDKKHP